MVIATPYPLFNLEQLWTYAYGGDRKRLQFANQASEEFTTRRWPY